MSFRNPDNAQFADDNAYLFEVGGNIGKTSACVHIESIWNTAKSDLKP